MFLDALPQSDFRAAELRAQKSLSASRQPLWWLLIGVGGFLLYKYILKGRS